MIDIKLLRRNINNVSDRLKTRGYIFDVDFFFNLELSRYRIQIIIENLKYQLFCLSKKIGFKKKYNKDCNKIISELLIEAEKLGLKIKYFIEKFELINFKIKDILYKIPNLPYEGINIGITDDSNKVVRSCGKIIVFNKFFKNHVEIGNKIGLDFKSAVKLSGTNFVVLKGQIASLHRAIGQFMIDTHIKLHGYTEVYAPYIVNSDSLFGTGQFPKFYNDVFSVLNKEKKIKYLIPTSEITLVNIMRNCIILKNELPIKFVSHSPCFRSESNSYGRDSFGIIRQYQFDKVEIVQFVLPEKSSDALKEIVNNAEVILKYLELPYRIVELCTSNIGFASSITYDIEVWFPSECRYREVSSCSNTDSFQSRRIKCRYRDIDGNIKFVHILNGSGLAIGRTLAAILENFQNIDGSVTIPKILRKYLNGLKYINK